MDDEKRLVNPDPTDEINEILHFLREFYVIRKMGTREELMAAYSYIEKSYFNHVLHFADKLGQAEKKLIDGDHSSVHEDIGWEIQVIMVYAALAHCVEAMRPGLTDGQRWWWVSHARSYMGEIRGALLGEQLGALVSTKGRAKNGAAARHKENRQMKLEVFEWLTQNIERFKSLDSAAEAIAGDIVPVKFRTAREWVGQWKKAQSSEEK